MDSAPPVLSSAYDGIRHAPLNADKARQYARENPLSPRECAELAAAGTVADFLRRCNPKWLMGWRDITNATNEWTIISGIMPLTAMSNHINVVHSDIPTDERIILYAMLNSLAVNYAIRQKMGGTTLNYFYAKQLPILPPESFGEEDKRYLVPRVLELCYTAWDLRGFYEDVVACDSSYDPRLARGESAVGGKRGEPFSWRDERRALLRAEIEARIAHKYGLSREDLAYILDPSEVMGADYPSETFRVLKEKEIKRHGEYRLSRQTLTAFDATAASDASNTASAPSASKSASPASESTADSATPAGKNGASPGDDAP